MIVEYHRPDSVEAALQLLSRSTPATLPLGGGTILNRPGMKDPVAVVDLQDLRLDEITVQGNVLQIGATVTLQQMFEAAEIPPAVKKAIHQEASYNLRQMGTLAGTLVSADGRSPLATVLLALDAQLTWAPGEKTITLGEWLPLRGQNKPGVLITQVSVPARAEVAYQAVSRTEDDFPIVCAAMAKWPSGRKRLVLGGFGTAPVVVLDGAGAGGEETAARDAFSNAADKWASAEYRQEMAAVLALRCANEVGA